MKLNDANYPVVKLHSLRLGAGRLCGQFWLAVGACAANTASAVSAPIAMMLNPEGVCVKTMDFTVQLAHGTTH